MAIKIKFDLIGNPEPPTIILANRNGNRLGQLKVNTDSIEIIDKLDTPEFSFTINKYIDDKPTPLWDKVLDFKLVYCKEWDTWFEVKVELDEETETVKTVYCTQLGQSELSQIMLYDVELNTEKDIERDDYKISILYDESDPKSSMLHRLLEKAPHYSIIHVDDTIAKMQRSFSFSDTSICDAFQEIAEEIGCLFVYNSNSDASGKIQRTISVYDLQQNCSDCGYRGEFTDKCPKCGSTNIKYGYGEDTLIFVTSDELASEGIQLVTDTDSVKNCFKLEAGDDLMTATVRNCNPNGTDYLWYFSDAVKEDMSDELVEKLESYDESYKTYYNDYESDLDTGLLTSYNALVNKYSAYNENLQTITSSITGYLNLMNAFYNVVDLALYLESGLMPSVEMSDTNATEQARLLTLSPFSAVAVNTDNISSVSLATANSAVLSMAKIIVKSTYKVEVGNSTLSNDKIWRGNFVVTNYSDEEDTATSGVIEVVINNDSESFIKQKIEKTLNKDNTDDYSISGLFKREYDDFCAELKKYALNPLKSFYDACDACLNILIDQGAGNKNEKPDLYEKLYEPYYAKSSAISNEIKIRENEIAIVKGVWDKTDEENQKLITKGLQQYIEECRNKIQNALDFEKHLGEELWLEFCAYRREDTYSNDNYISDGLNNAELFKRAKEFYELAENEIYKSAELQHSISTTLNNLLVIDKFKSLVKSFKVGNWIRVRVDDEIFKLRLLEYKIRFNNFNNIPVEFSDVAKVKNGITDVESILSQVSSMATSYSHVQKQAIQGNEAQGTINEWLTDGLNSALVQIQNNSNEDLVFDRNGLLCRSYDDITSEYSPEQFRLTHNIMAYTTDNWKTVSSALGKHEYTKWKNNQWIKDIDYGLTSKFVTAGYVTGSQIIGGEIVSSNYKKSESGTYFNLIDGDFDIAGGSIVYDSNDKALTLKNVTIEWSSSSKPEITDISGIDEYLDKLEKIEDQLDGKAETWYQDTDPSDEWTTEELKSLHVGDLWHYTGETTIVNGIERTKNSEWIWQEVNGKYEWVAIEISDIVFDAIDGKAQIFIDTPTPPYHIGDLWVQGASGDIFHCVISKAEGQLYSANDWVLSSKYTDDTLAQEALDEAKQGIKDAADAISIANAAQSLANSADKKAQDAETNAKSYTDSQNTSLSESLTNAYKAYTNSEISILDSYVAKYLGLGGSTIIGDNYVISPIIEGGYLNITNVDNNSRVIIDPNNLTENNYIFQVHNGSQVTLGIDKDGNASFNGSIVATSLVLDGAKISTEDIDGIEEYAKIGEIPGVPENVLTTDKVTISSATTADGVTTQSITVGDNTYTSIIAGDFIFTNLGLGTDTENGSKSYFCVSTDGLLTAKNAIIYGTVFATDGKFSGDIVANSLVLGNDVFVSTDNIDGLSSVATSGKYSDLSGTPTIPTSVEDLGFDTSSIIYKGDITQTVKTDKDGNNYLETTVPSSDGSITYATYDAGDYIVLGKTMGEIKEGEEVYKENEGYVCISKEGLLTARNALIYGTVYATAGEFSGSINVADSFTVDTNGNTKITADSTIQISAGNTKDSFITFGDGFAVSKDGLSAVSGDFTSLTVGGKKVITEDSLSSKIVVSATEPTQTGVIWVKPESVQRVEYQGFTHTSRDWSILGISNQTRNFTISCLSADTLPDGMFRYTIKFPIILVWNDSKESNVEFTVSATKASDSSKKVTFDPYILASITEWQTKVIEMSFETSVNLCYDTSDINISITTRGCQEGTYNLYIDKEKYISFTAANKDATGNIQACSVYYKP